MSIEINTGDYIRENNSSEFTTIVKENQVKKWFFFIGLNETYTVTGTYFEACESVKSNFKNSKRTKFGIIKLSKIENIT